MLQKGVRRTDQEWLDLIHECRTSGLTDKDWCETHQISRSNFYYHLRRLRKKACGIPAASSSRKISLCQEVVPVEIRDDSRIRSFSSSGAMPPLEGASCNTAINIRIRDIRIQILNGADRDVVNHLFSAMAGLC